MTKYDTFTMTKADELNDFARSFIADIDPRPYV